jgi:hypothetical protein
MLAYQFYWRILNAPVTVLSFLERIDGTDAFPLKYFFYIFSWEEIILE